MCMYSASTVQAEKSKAVFFLVLNKSKLSLLLFDCTLFITLHSKPYTKLIQ